MEALIIVAHGSKIKSSNDEIIEISNKIKNKNENTFYAFLELSEPSFSIKRRSIRWF
jgi:sirohydrochlorin cobaltochelatase